MPKLIIGVDAVGIRALAGPVTGAALLFDAATPEPAYRSGGAHYSLREPQKIPRELVPHVMRHLWSICLGHSKVHCPGAVVTSGKESAWDAMGRAAARTAERAKHLRPDDCHVGLNNLEIYIPEYGGQLPYELVGRVGQRPAGSSWQRGAAHVFARHAHSNIMHDLDIRFPKHGFLMHHGRATDEHKAAIRRYGPTVEHRRAA